LNEPQLNGRQPSGCLAAFAVGLCLSWSLLVGVVGGAISYFVAYMAGAPSIGSYIGGAVTAFVIVWLTCPAGSALIWFFLPVQSSPLTRSFVSLLMAFVAPTYFAGAVFVFAALSAVAGALLFRWCPPLTAAILIATVFPLVGMFAGAAVGDPGYGGR
jgi:hypothetical protein